MQKCILEGHRPATFDGKGEHDGKKFRVCTECGVTLGEVTQVERATAQPGRCEGARDA